MSEQFPTKVPFTPDGHTVNWDLPSTPIPSSLLLMWNGEVQDDVANGGSDYSVDGNVLTTNFTANAGDQLFVYYTTYTPPDVPVASPPTSGPFNPELIALALLSLLQNVNFPFQTIGRDAKIWTNTPPADQPALYLIGSGAVVAYDQANDLENWVMEFIALIYIRGDAASNSVPETALNEALLAVLQSLRYFGEAQTLGGTVLYARVEGEVVLNVGILDQQTSVAIPIRVRAGY